MEGVFQQERSVTSCLVELVETCKPVDHTAATSVCYGFIRFANQIINRKELVAVRIYLFLFFGIISFLVYHMIWSFLE